MRTYFHNLAEVMASPLVSAARTARPGGGQNRVFKSTRLEDMVYRDLRQGDTELDTLESSCGEKLSTFPALSRDIYQSFYSLNIRKTETDTLSETAKRFNSPILDEVMRGEDYPAIKAACEGRQLPAYEAAGEFISQVADNLDSLMEQVGGEKKALDTLERLEQKRDKSSCNSFSSSWSSLAQILSWRSKPLPRQIRPKARSIRLTPWAAWCRTAPSRTRTPLPRWSLRRERRRQRKRRVPPPR